MNKITVSSIEQLKEILETPSDEVIEISLEKNTYEIYETINIKRNNFTLKGNGSTIKGSKKIDLTKHEAQDGIIKIDLTEYGVNLKDYHNIEFSWCNDNKFDEVHTDIPRDPFGKAITDGPYCGSVYTVGKIGPDIDAFYEDKAMNLTRYPKTGYMRIKETLSDYEEGDELPLNVEGGPKGIFSIDDENFTKMQKAEEAILFGYWAFDWAPNHHSIKAVDSDKNIIEVDAPYNRYGYWDGRGKDKQIGKFYATNIFEGLDEEGTWFVDRKNKVLYIHPFLNQKEVEIPVCDTIFFGKETKNSSFEDLKICQCTSCVFLLEKVCDINIKNVEIKNVGEWGIVAKFSYGVNVSDCTISAMGGGGIFLEGGDRVSLTPSRNIVKNCEIYDTTKYYTVYASAIEIRGVGTVVSGCKIHDLPHFAVFYHGNNHIIENNEIYKVCNCSNDAGAIYTGRDYTFYGNIIRNNFFHDLYGMDNKGCSCIYFDDYVSSAEVYGNIFANIYYSIQLGGGHDFAIHHNIFYNCDFMLLDNRAREGFWSHDFAIHVRKRLMESPYKNDAWRKAYPKLYNADVESDDFFLPYGNSITDNRFINCGDIMIEAPEIKDWFKFENNTFIKRDKTTNIDNEDITPNMRYIYEMYSPLDI